MGPRGTRALAAEPQRLLTACSTFTPAYWGLALAEGWGEDQQEATRRLSHGGAEEGGGISDRLSCESKGASQWGHSAFRVLLSVRETDTSEQLPAPQRSSVCKQGVKSNQWRWEWFILTRGGEEKLGRGGGS